MTDLAHARRDIAVDRAALARLVAEWIVSFLVRRDGVLAVALSGGGTPKPVYELLATPPLRDALPWPRLHWFWGDERFVPPNHADSNYRMVREAMLARAPVPPECVHRIPTEGAPEDAASSYDAELRRFQREHRRSALLFDIVLLGIGGDGHTASLFPGAAALEEQTRFAVAVRHSSLGPRITLTLPALGDSAAVAFIAAGAEKRAALARSLAGDESLPAARVRSNGEVHCFFDRAAAPEQ